MTDNVLFVPKSVLENVVARVAHVLGSTGPTASMGMAAAELEAMVTRRVDVAEFTRLLRYCRAQGLRMVQLEPTLDVSFANVIVPKGHASLVGVRVSVIGAAGISQYFVNNALEALPLSAVKVIRKTHVRGFPHLDIAQYNVRVNLRMEESCAMSAFDPKVVRSTPKTFRLKNRVSFMSHDSLFRYDFTRVRMSTGTAQHVSSSGLTKSVERYEVEVELLHPSSLQVARSLLQKLKAASHTELATLLLSHMGMLQCAMSGSPCVLSTTDHAAAIKAYEQVAGTHRFIGRQPVTLECHHLLPHDRLPPNAKSIATGYSVTAKYDGDRHLLLVAKPTGKVFLMSRANRVASVKYIGISLRELAGTLIDGEYLQDEGVYAAFDAYYVSGEDVRGKNLAERLVLLERDVVPALARVADRVTICTKKFEMGEDIHAACARVLEDIAVGDVPYETDGLVFTPTGPVEGDNPIFKWKPPEQNTVDFLVRFENTLDTATTMGLYCSQRQSGSTKQLGPLAYLQGQHMPAAGKGGHDRVLAKRFTPAPTMQVAHLNASDARVPRCRNGDVIDDMSIVECTFLDGQWVPLRVRYDKVQEMLASRRITANNYDTTALSVWRTILQPVTRELLTGEQQVPDDVAEQDDDIYYNRKSLTRDELDNSGDMRRFHNSAIKLCVLLGWAVKELSGKGDGEQPPSVLDIGCGRGGDISKYMQLGVQRMLGFDPVVDNIRNPRDGAYARLRDALAREPLGAPKRRYAFLSMDALKDFASDPVSAAETEEDRQAARVLWGLEGGDSSSTWSEFATAPFDIVSLMFNLHYMCGDETSFMSLVDNIRQCTRPGSLVVGACMDGKVVQQQLKNETLLQGKTEAGHIIYQIEKQYEDAQTGSYGRTIGVFVDSINQVIQEYLVDFDEVDKRFKAAGFDLVQRKSFRDAYVLVLEDAGALVSMVPGDSRKRKRLHETLLASVEGMSQAEQDFSFMHCYFVYRRTR